MKLLWISGRRIGYDMAGTTEIELISAINSTKDEVVLISPGEKKDWGDKHIPIKILNFPGLITISGSFGIRLKFKKLLSINDFDAIIIDWRYVSLLSRILKNTGIPWFMIDRGPPAKQNWKLKLQKYMWKKSWKIVNNHGMNGIVVSQKHNDFIKKYANIEMQNIIVNSGSEQISGKIKHVGKGSVIEILYIGQIDSRRDIKSILDLKSEMDNKLLKNRIRIVGEGDLVEWLKNKIKGMSGIEIIGKKNKIEIQKILDSSHVGILPMPNNPIWEMASPIKLVEYARHGLMTIGPKHLGHRWSDEDNVNARSWELLSNDDKWWIQSVELLEDLVNNEQWRVHSKEAINDSKERTWSKISRKMISDISKELVNN